MTIEQFKVLIETKLEGRKDLPPIRQLLGEVKRQNGVKRKPSAMERCLDDTPEGTEITKLSMDDIPCPKKRKRPKLSQED